MVVAGWRPATQFMLTFLGHLEVELWVVGINPLLFCLLIGFAALGLPSHYLDVDIVVGLDFFLIDSLTSTVIDLRLGNNKIPFKRIYDSILRGSLTKSRILCWGSMAGILSDPDGDCHGAINILIAASVERVWAIGSDWLNFPRQRCWVECVQGENGVPGCIRRVRPRSTDTSSSNLTSNFWVTEKLTHIDHERRVLRYEIVGGNMGIQPGYQAGFQIFKEGDETTRVVWSFRFSPGQSFVDALTPIVMAKVTGYVQELESLAKEESG